MLKYAKSNKGRADKQTDTGRTLAISLYRASTWDFSDSYVYLGQFKDMRRGIVNVVATINTWTQCHNLS